MLLKNVEGTEEFLKVFRKKFDNFCQKAPILLSYQADKTQVLLQNIYSKDQYVYQFDYMKEVTENIKEIKDWLLENWYPVMEEEHITESELSRSEIEEMVENGIPVEKAALAKRTEKTVTNWRIEKIIVRKDEIFVRNMDDDRFYRYVMHMPVTLFLKRHREKLTPTHSWTMFKEKAELLNEIYKDYDPTKQA